MDPLLVLDWESERRRAVRFVRRVMRKAGHGRVVLGLSGGVDSALVAALCAEAMGPENVLAVFLPYRTSSPDSLEDAVEMARLLRLRSRKFEITPVVDAYLSAHPDADAVRRGNVMARVRMLALWDAAKETNALVAGTGNRTEWLFGYFTLHGDGAFAFAPIAGFFKTQVWEIARRLGVPDKIVSKTPSADLWPGQSDEGELGCRYSTADSILVRLLDHDLGVEKVIDEGFDAATVRRVADMVAAGAFKRSKVPMLPPPRRRGRP